MPSIRDRLVCRFPAALGVMVLTAMICALPGMAEAKPTPPQLSIAVDDGKDSAAPGDTLSYRVTVTNLGAKLVTGLHITQTIPADAKLVSANHGGTRAAQSVSWQIDLKPGASATRQTTVAVAKTLPSQLLRLAIVACAQTSATAPPTVCASDSDQLPAGATAESQRGAPDQPKAAIGDWWPLPGAIVLGGLLLAMVVAVAVVLWRHTRRPNSHAPADLVSSSRR